MIGTLRPLQSALCRLRRKQLTLLSPLPSKNGDSINRDQEGRKRRIFGGETGEWLEYIECIVLGGKSSEQVEKLFGNVDLKSRKGFGMRIVDP